MKTPPTAAQALVLLKDQAEIFRIAASHRGETSEVSTIMRGLVPNSLEDLLRDGNSLRMNSFLNWMSQS